MPQHAGSGRPQPRTVALVRHDGAARTVTAALVAATVALVATAAVAQDASASQPDRPAASAHRSTNDRSGGYDLDRVPDEGAVRLLVTADDPAALTVLSDGGFGFSSAPSRVAPRVAAVDVPSGDVRSVAARLSAADGVVAVEENRLKEFYAAPDDPLYERQWTHRISDAETAWDVTTGDPSTVVAVIDSGVVSDHPDLADRVVGQFDSSSGQVVDGADGDNDRCGFGHGTWVSGVAAATGGNAEGVSGVSQQASVLDINATVPDCAFIGAADDAILSAMTFAVEEDVDVINLSLGGPLEFCPAAYQAVIDDALAAGIAVVAASGNTQEGSPGVPNVPASCDGVISVGSVGSDSAAAVYSATNEHVDLVAGGGAGDGTAENDPLTTSWWDGQGERTDEYVAVAGTSFAAPYVSGVVALLLAADPDLTPDDVEGVMEASAADLGDAGRDDTFGWGLVQAGAAMGLVTSGDVPAPEPDPGFPVEGQPAPEPTPEPTTSPDPEPEPGTDPTVTRISDTDAESTTAIGQAVAVSQGFADDGAEFGIVARDDEYADSLAGGSLSLGAGPLLFTGNTGPLDPATAAELERVLEPGATVYVLGGPVAVDGQVDDDLAALGFAPERLAGDVRETTAVAISDEVRDLVGNANGEPSAAVILANRDDWPDAVSASALGAQFGVPVLLTPPDELAAPTAAALEAYDPDVLYVVGGTVRVTDAAMSDAAAAAGVAPDSTVRLAGSERTGTAVAVSREVASLLDSAGRAPTVAVTFNMTVDDGWSHLLSAAPLLATSAGLLLPVIDDDGSVVTPAVAEHAGEVSVAQLAVLGGQDVVGDDTAVELAELLGG